MTFIPNDLLFIHPDLQAIVPTIQIYSDRYVLLEVYQSLDVIKAFVGGMKHQYNLDVVFLPLNIGDGGIDQDRYLKERISEII